MTRSLVLFIILFSFYVCPLAKKMTMSFVFHCKEDDDECSLSSLTHHPKLLDRFNYESKCENIRRIGVEACSLAHNTLRVEGCARAPRWGLGRVKSNSITHMDLHKPNNKLGSA
jgi:hypothetical protein